MALGSLAHRAARGFVRGGLVAVLALLGLPLIAAAATVLPLLRPLVAAVRLLSVPLAFALGGLAAGPFLERGRRGTVASFLGAAAAGSVMAWPSGMLRGLSGFEPIVPLVVVPLVSLAVAFGLHGAIVAWCLAGPAASRVAAAWSAAAGAVGAVLTVLPALLVRTSLRPVLSDAWAVIEATCSVAGIVLPFAIVGWSVGRALERPLDRASD